MNNESVIEVVADNAQKAIKEILAALFYELRSPFLSDHDLDDSSDVLSVPAHMGETFWHLFETFKHRNWEYSRNDPMCVFSDQMVAVFDDYAQRLDEEKDSIEIQFRGMYILLMTLSDLFLIEIEKGCIAMTRDDEDEYGMDLKELKDFVEMAREDMLCMLDHIEAKDMIRTDGALVETSAGHTIQ